MRPDLRGPAMLVALVAIAALGVLAAPASGHHVSFDGARVQASEVPPAKDGSSRVRVSWNVRCSNADIYHGVVMLYSYEHGRVISAVSDAPFLSSKRTVISRKTVGPGRYKPQIHGPACGAVANDEAHVAPGPRIVDGPDFEICAGARAGAARRGGAWPVIPVPNGCGPDCRSGSSASRLWPVIPRRARCGPERVTKRNEAPVPIECPGGASGSRAWPVVPARGPCSGRVRLDTAKRVPCAATAARWPVVPVRCSAVRRKRLALGSARFRLRAGRVGVVPVKLRPKARRTVRRLKRVRVKATITLRKGRRRVRTVRVFTLRAR